MIGGFFSEEKVSEVRLHSSILEVVSDYVSLKKTGRNYKGLCPFHSEKTPSFMVNEEKQIFHCFGCGEGGDVFRFLMKIGQFSFPQAVEELAKRYGVKLPSPELSPGQKRDLAKRDLLFQINQVASDYYHDLLLREKEGAEARRYLSARGIREGDVEEYRLGYSLDRWDGLVRHLQDKKLPLDFAHEVGLVSPKRREGWYDVFRGRIMFPVFDLYQRVVGFGGRLIKAGEPKYLNSPESAIYHKGETLYGLPVAKRHLSLKDQVLIVEGYFDLLTIQQHGFPQSIATLGTALTPHHIRTLKRYTNNFITIFDGDSAGIQAALRCLPLFLEEEVWGEAVLLPQGEDPDGFLRKGNQKAFERMIEKRVPLLDFFLEQRMTGRNRNSVEEKVKVAKEGLGLIRKIPEEIRRNFYLKVLAEKLDLQESLLHHMLGAVSNQTVRGTGDPKSGKEKESFSRSEELMISLMVHHPELIPEITEQMGEQFKNAGLKGMAACLTDLFKRSGRIDLAEAITELPEHLREGLCTIVFRGSPEGDPRKMLEDCVRKIEEGRLKGETRELLRRIREAEARKGGKELEALLMERQKLAEREKSLHAVRKMREG